MPGSAEHHPQLAGVSSVDLEVLRTTLIGQTGELAAALAAGAPTYEVSQMRQFAVALAEVTGGIVAIDDPLQLGSIAQTAAFVADYFQFDLDDGDVILTNDPYSGGTRVQDVTLSTPLVLDGEIVMHLLARVRIRDIGGQVGGNLYPGASEILAEGHPVTPIKVQRLGRPVRDTLYMFLLNGRRAEDTRGTLDAAIAALGLGRRRLLELFGRYGVNAMHDAVDYAQAYSEQLLRNAVARWRNGSYEGACTLDLDPVTGDQVTLRLNATVSDDHVVLDFSDCDNQRPLFINSSQGSTASAALSAVLALVGGGVPANSGVLRVVDIRTRPGTITHPIEPAPVGWGPSHCGNEVTEVVAATLQHAVGDPIPALTVPRPLVLSRPVSDRSNQTDLGRWLIGGASAVAGVDGWGPPQLSTRAELPSVEQWETENDMRVDSVEFLPDSGGHGRWRGAPSVEVTLSPPSDRLYTLWTAVAEATVGGAAGGSPGAPGDISFCANDRWQPAPRLASEEPNAGGQLRLRSAGGGGYGQPMARDRTAVLNDLADGLISPDAARSIYKLSADEIEAESGPMIVGTSPKEGCNDG